MKPSARILSAALFCAGLAVAALAPLAAPAGAAEMTPARRQAIEAIIHDYLLHHPRVMIEALQNAEQQAQHDAHAQVVALLKSHRRAVFRDPASPVGGNPHGDVSVVEFFDYQCPYCKGVEPALERLIKQDPQLRFVYKEFPVLGPESVVAARAALAAMKQGKYVAFHQALLALKGRLSTARIYRVAGDVGLDPARLKRDMAAPEVAATIKDDLALADLLSITGTPTFIIGDEIVPGAAGFDKLKALVAQARKG